MDYEGHKGELLIKRGRLPMDGKTRPDDQVTDELRKPNGICFSPDTRKSYIVTPARRIFRCAEEHQGV